MKIVRKDESLPTRSLVGLIYGEPGVGKTSVAMRVQNRPILHFDFDKGIGRAVHRVDSAQMESWLEVKQFIESPDILEYKGGVFVIDTVKALLDDFMTADIVRANPKDGKATGGLSMQGFGVLKDTFSYFLRTIQRYNIDVIFIAHQKEDKKGKSDVNRYTPDVTGSSLSIILGKADFVGYINTYEDVRFISFQPSDTQVGKNPAQLVPGPIPAYTEEAYMDYMGDKLRLVIAKMSEQTEAQRVATAFVEEADGLFNSAENWGDICAIAEDPKLFVPSMDISPAYIISVRNKYVQRAAGLLEGYLTSEDVTPVIISGIAGVINTMPIEVQEREPLRNVLRESMIAWGITYDKNTKEYVQDPAKAPKPKTKATGKKEELSKESTKQEVAKKGNETENTGKSEAVPTELFTTK